MKVKLLKKLRKKFYIRKTTDGWYIVEGSSSSSEKITQNLDEARKLRRNYILSEARFLYGSYSVLRNKRYN
jgi:hypothetical protein